jgi:hypothetical protein
MGNVAKNKKPASVEFYLKRSNLLFVKSLLLIN